MGRPCCRKPGPAHAEAAAVAILLVRTDGYVTVYASGYTGQGDIMVDVAQLAERPAVAGMVAGSSPVVHPVLRRSE